MLRKYRLVVLVFTITSLMSFFMVYLALNDKFENVSISLPSVMQKPVAEFGGGDGIADGIVKFHYLACGHTITGKLPAGVDIAGMSVKEVRRTLPEEDGWVVVESNGKLEITQYNEALCPEDQQKTHLGAVGNFVGVFQGPVGVNSRIIEVTDIPISNLPSNWQYQLKQGDLDFASIKRLKETLDSLDEYSLKDYGA